MKGMRVTGVSCIFQFDAVTGNQNFLGYYDDAGGSSFDLVNVNLPSASVGNGIYQGDKVRYHGYVLGSYTYSRATGGTNTVPSLEVTSMKAVGHHCS